MVAGEQGLGLSRGTRDTGLGGVRVAEKAGPRLWLPGAPAWAGLALPRTLGACAPGCYVEGPKEEIPSGSVPGLGKRLLLLGLDLGHRKQQESIPGQVAFCTCGCISAGQAPTSRLSAASPGPQPPASLPYLLVHLQQLPHTTNGLSFLCPQDSTMGFSSELCSSQGHGAVQQMQEAELRLLEGMRKWMAQRVKSDREYAGLLHHMSLQDSGAQSRGGSDSPINQVGFSGTLGLLTHFPP